MKIKVGSLFDGIGGTPLSAVLSGAEPVWASEIEQIPISITKRHFPNMKHYGDITQINGAEIEPVDIIVGGSPCQDLSVAGKRAGLAGERSGLFMDQVRIVKEMRNATRRETSDRSDQLPRPRYMVWENVPGAFSSNKGEDFRAVLEETARVADPTISIPRSVNGWASAGSILADRFSISWRTFDAQYWGVPQRRRRIYLVADFGGHTAPEICFERESLPGDITEGGEAEKGVAADAERSSGAAGESYMKSAVAYSLQGNMIGRADHNGPQGSGVNEDVSFTLNTVDRHAVCYGIDQQGGKSGANFTENIAPTMLSDSHGTPHAVCYGIGSYHSGGMKSANPHSGFYEADTSKTIDQNGGNPACNQGGIAVVQSEPYLIEMTSTKNTVVSDGICPTLTARMGTGGNQVNAVCLPQSEQKYIVRRLTPLECERLQGYPDGWTALDHEDKAVSDTQRYKALGNSFAVPNALFVISRCVKQLQKEDGRDGNHC